MIVLNGIEYASWPAVAAAHGVNVRTYAKRYYEQGWDQARAATELAEIDPIYEHEGVALGAAGWATRLGWPRHIIYKRLQRGMTIGEVITAGYSKRTHRPTKLTVDARTISTVVIRQSAKDREQRNREIIRKYKDRPCKDCKGVYHTDVMEFDHVRGKKLSNLSETHGWSLRRIAAEIAKCDLVCANCHRIRTASRRP